MCLQALAAFAPRDGFRLLDVGSGTARSRRRSRRRSLGGHAVGVEIDPVANDVARRNAERNLVSASLTFSEDWPAGLVDHEARALEGRAGAFDVVVANILRDILLLLAPEIAPRLAAGGLLVLSGLVSTDVPAIIASLFTAARRSEA